MQSLKPTANKFWFKQHMDAWDNINYQLSTVAVYVQLHVEICYKDGTLWSPQVCYGWIVYNYMELSAGIAAWPVINPNIFLSPTEDIPLRQSLRFISTLVTVTSMEEWANITYTIHTYICYAKQNQFLLLLRAANKNHLKMFAAYRGC